MVSQFLRLCLAALLCVSSIASASFDYHWSLGPSLPKPVQDIHPVIFKDAIYVVGGITAESDTFDISDKVFRLRSGETKWQTLPDFPEPMHHVMLVATDKVLMAFGGFKADTKGQWVNSDSVYLYEPKTSSWTKKNPLPVKISESVSAVLDGKIHLAGGRTTTDANNQWHHHIDSSWHGVYDPEAGVWQTSQPLAIPRNSACSIVVNGKWHVIGGRTVGAGNSDSHSVFDPVLAEWTEAKPLPKPISGSACSVLNDDIYVFGGEVVEKTERGVFYQVWRFETSRQRWTEVSVMPIPRHGLGAVHINNTLWLIGGASGIGASDSRRTVSQFSKKSKKGR